MDTTGNAAPGYRPCRQLIPQAVGDERRLEAQLDTDPVWALRLHYSDGIHVFCPVEGREMRATDVGKRCPVCGPVHLEIVPLVTMPALPVQTMPWDARTRAADKEQARILDPDYYAANAGDDRRRQHSTWAEIRAGARGGIR